MAYLEDIYKTVKEQLNYKITITNGGFVAEDFKSIIYHSKEHIELRAGKTKLVFDGKNFSIKELQRGLLIVCGDLQKYEAVRI